MSKSGSTSRSIECDVKADAYCCNPSACDNVKGLIVYEFPCVHHTTGSDVPIQQQTQGCCTYMKPLGNARVWGVGAGLGPVWWYGVNRRVHNGKAVEWSFAPQSRLPVFLGLTTRIHVCFSLSKGACGKIFIADAAPHAAQRSSQMYMQAGSSVVGSSNINTIVCYGSDGDALLKLSWSCAIVFYLCKLQ